MIRRRLLLPALILSAALVPSRPGEAQQVGIIQGRVVTAGEGRPVYAAEVHVPDLSRRTFTDREGRFSLERVAPGRYTLLVTRLDHAPREVRVQVRAGDTARVEIQLELQAVRLGELTVTSATRRPQRVVEAPAPVAVLSRETARDFSVTHQAPRALVGLPGVHVAQSGVYDFNVNARGFNTSLNRRVLVLQDGRDLSVPFLGSQEWAALSVPLEEMERVEMIRGPGSALYGANAFSGVLSLTTPTAREARGTRISVSGGGLSTLDADARHAGVFGQGRFGYRVSAGVYRSDTWSRSRTERGSLEDEYRNAVDLDEHPVTAPSPGYEQLPLLGQEKEAPPGVPGPATGEPDPVRSFYGTGRFDWYTDGGSILTVEAGAARAENPLTVTPIGRIQVEGATRPWARLEWASERLNVSAWYSGRQSDDQLGLQSGFRIAESSAIYHAEVQYNQPFAGERGRVVAGISARATGVTSDTTFVASGDEDRLDGSYAAYGQVEYDLAPRLRLVAASRLDGGLLFDPQLSPRAALVYTPGPGSSLRLGVNRAFKTPNILEYFLAVPAGPDQDLTQAEDLARELLGSALDGVAEGTLFTDSDQVPVFAFGNDDLEVERVTGLEVGYKGLVGSRLYLTADLFYSRVDNLITDLLPRANPEYGPWSAPPGVAPSAREPLEEAVDDVLGPEGLTRLDDGRTAFVVSIGNAGRARTWGMELAAGYTATPDLSLDANYTYFGLDVEGSSVLPGDRITPNTPEHSGTVGLTYGGWGNLDARVRLHAATGFEWVSGIYAGYVPARWTVDLSLGWQATDALRLTALATNLLDHDHYQLFGGSVIGRRLLAGASFTH